MEILGRSIFSGIQKFTTIDDKGHIGMILFTGGCNFRCSYCHNPLFVLPEKIKFIEKQEILDLLEKRKNLVESVIICGGEPTLHPNLLDWIDYIKLMGFRVKLDTNATNPSMFKEIIGNKKVDFVAIDYKAPKAVYSKIINVNTNLDIIIDNLKFLVNSGVDYEIRTTIHPDLHSRESIFKMMDELEEIGIKNYYLQVFKMPPETVGVVRDKKFENGFFDEIELELKKRFEKTGIRNL